MLGAEHAGKGNDVALAPTMNILRVPGWGRAFETFSEDPELAGDIGAAEIRGIQGQGVIADAKHFAANNQETDRLTVNAVVAERALREIYTAQFEKAVKDGGVRSLMCAYNQVNGDYACQNPHLLSDILKRDWGFDGFVVSDWFANHSTVAVGQRRARPRDAGRRHDLRAAGARARELRRGAEGGRAERPGAGVAARRHGPPHPHRAHRRGPARSHDAPARTTPS